MDVKVKKQQYQLEFVFKDSSFSALWNMISTPQGLENWFADKAYYIDENTIGFEWDKQLQTAHIKHIKPNEYARFCWSELPDKYYFEFRIGKNELTGAIVLIITDFATPQEMEYDKQLWENNVGELCRILGI